MTQRRKGYCLLPAACCLLFFVACTSQHRKPRTPREARIFEYLRSYPDTGAGRLSLMETGYIFRGMTLAQFQAVAGFRPAEELTLEANPRHILSLSYRGPGDESSSAKDTFVFVDGALYSWEIKSFRSDPPETPQIPREYSGQK